MGQTVAPVKNARVLGVDVGLGAPTQHLPLLPLLHLFALLDGGHDGLGEVVVAHRRWVPFPQVRGVPAHPSRWQHWTVGGGNLLPLHFRLPDVAHFGGQVGRVEAHRGHSSVGHALAGSGWGDAGVEQAVVGQAAVPVGECVGREDALVRGGGDRLRLQGCELAFLWSVVTLLQAERARADGVGVQLEWRGLEGPVEGGVGVFRHVQVWLGAVVMTTDTLLQDG